jgi:hypothetical protein
VSLFVWVLPFDLSGMGDHTSSYATAGIALRVTESHKPPHHCKVETGCHTGSGIIKTYDGTSSSLFCVVCCYAAYVGSYLHTFWHSLSVPSPSIKQSNLVEDGTKRLS